jgi:lysine-N-methylase
MRQDLTLRYVSRFRCIGPACEDHCCHSWTVGVDEKNLQDLMIASTYHPEMRQRITEAVIRDRPREQDLLHKLGKKAKKAKKFKLYKMQLAADGNCLMLDDNRLCRIHGAFGEALLSNVCATYPRHTQRMEDGHIEMTGMLSCPEMARQMLLHDDAMDLVPLDREAMSRVVLSDKIDPLDARPYLRLMREVRDWMCAIALSPDHPVEHRLFFMTYFAKRMSNVVDKRVMQTELAPLRAEMDKLRQPPVLLEIRRRFDALETPSALALLLARELIRPAGVGRQRDAFRRMVNDVMSSYERSRGLVDALSSDADHAIGTTDMESLWASYRERRDRLLAIPPARARLELYLRNFTVYYWMHRLPNQSPDLLIHTLRMLGQMAAQKFMLFGHPKLQAALNTYDADLAAAAAAASHDAAAAASQAAEAALLRDLDALTVEVFFRTARYIEHSPLLRNIETALDAQQLRSVAGAVYLIRL